MENGEKIVDPLEINNIFKLYYENLYKSECTNNLEGQDNFLDKLQFPKLLEGTRSNSERNLSIEELSKALQGMSSGKAPGPDSLPMEIYKMFAGKLLPHLLEMFNESFEKGILSPSLRSALIILILKPGKPPNEKSSYRQISLMSCNFIILCNALAKRIETHIPNVIMNDQNGFVLGRQPLHNI